jgi:hypothetical protein
VNGLPAISDAALPADVRRAGATQRDAYRAALGFEQLLAGQVVKAMAQSGALAEGPYAATLQDTLTSALTSGGGLGLARQLYERAGAQTGTVR